MRSPAIQCPPARVRERRFSSEEKPRSTTVTTRPKRQPRRPSLTSVMTDMSLVLPGQHHTRTGIPSRVTARPITICGRSGRWSLLWPNTRNAPSPVSGSERSKYVARGVKEQQVDVEVEQIGAGEEHRLLD